MTTWTMRALRRSPGLWLILVLLVGGAAFAVVRARGPKVHTAVAIRRNLEQHVVASGRVWIPTRVEVSAQAPGLVVAVPVVEGQSFKAGDLLVQLDDAEARAAVAQAKAAVDQASARIDQLRRVGAIVSTEALRQAQTNLEHAQNDLERSRKLASGGALAPADLDNARQAVELARAQRTSAEAQQIASAPTGADSRVALTGLLQAQAQLEGAGVRLKQTKILALQDGVVLTRSVEPGDAVQPSRTLLVLAAAGEPQLVFQADERNLAAIVLGQKARASADAYPEQVFEAVVSYIAPSIDPQRGSIEVRLSMPQPPKFLKPDMTVSVDIKVATKAQALTIPSDAVHDTASRAPWVLAVQGGRLVRKEVKLGIRGEGSIEIASGLDEGAEVVVPDGRVLSAGTRVRTARKEH